MADLEELNRCRLCSSQNNLTDVFGTAPNDELFRMIYACTSIRITYEKDFPCAVCSSCIRIVNQFYAYRKKCLDHDRQLKRIRGETDDDEDDGGDELMDDPLKTNSSKRKLRKARDRQFYTEVRKHIQSFLKTQVKEVERKALEKVDEALKKRKGKGAPEDVLLQMTVEPTDEIPEAVEYEVLNEDDSDEFSQQEDKQDENGMNYKLELESVYFESSDQEDLADSSFAGFDEQTELNGSQRSPAGATAVSRSASRKKRKLSCDATAADVSNQSKTLEKQLTEAQKKIDTLMQLNFDLELKRLRLENAGAAGVVSTRFTAEEDIMISVRELEEINERSSSDSVFVGILITRLVDPENLKNMSVTGHASPRFAKLKKPDGSPLYPPTEKIDPRIFDFICNKVAERTAMRIGPDDIHTIRKNSDERIIKRFIAQKISNLKKADIAKRFRVEGEPAWTGDTE
ncbi:uncharacterized protein LOC135699554 [Ochlerotatus camptorhynchus]|uniref:uncharacterized protein LOC135699554 n=1 Tax=Ochlerotatus camptorhynchus TaxID=644619 RepID=UPI0031D304B0